MNNTNNVDAAKQAIGKNQKGDYIINPTQHSEQLKEAAPELAAILGSSRVKAAAQEYERLDAEAIQAQKEFKKWSNRTHWAAFLTAFFSASLAISVSWSALFHLSNELSRYVIAFFTIGSAFFAALTGICIRQIRFWKLLEKWMESRAEAEEKRLNYFYKIADSQNQTNHHSLTSLYKLEYFRRFQLDVQISYYDVRSKQHEKSAKKYLSYSIYAMGIVTLLNLLAGSLGFFFKEPHLAAFAVFALMAHAFAATLTGIESVNQDRRNAERYRRTYAVLMRLNSKLDEVRKKIDEGNTGILLSFIEAVHEPISVEHRQWLVSFEEKFSAIGRLQQQLKS